MPKFQVTEAGYSQWKTIEARDAAMAAREWAETKGVTDAIELDIKDSDGVLYEGTIDVFIDYDVFVTKSKVIL